VRDIASRTGDVKIKKWVKVIYSSKTVPFLALLTLSLSVSISAETIGSEISGQILGADNRPLARASATLIYPGRPQPVALAETDENGRFRIVTDKRGLFLLWFAGVNHARHTAAVLLNKPHKVVLRERLATVQLKDEFRDLRLVGELPKSPLNGISLTRRPDGVYVAEVVTSEPTIGYSIAGASQNGLPIHGTDSQDFRFSRGRYYSVVKPVNGRATVVFDPGKVLQSPTPSLTEFPAGDPVNAAVTRLAQQIDARYEARQAALEQAQEPAPKGGMSRQLRSADPDSQTVETLKKQIAGERHPIAHQALLVEYLDMTILPHVADPTLVRQALDELGPRSPLWTLSPELAAKSIAASGAPEKYDGFGTEMADNFPAEIRPRALMWLVIAAHEESKNDRKAEEYIGRMKREFPNDSATKYVEGLMGKGRVVAEGKRVPDFSAPSLMDPNTIYTNATIKAKVYLIDFWATWCAPCIAEMPVLERAYKRFAVAGFEILSYSVDSNAEVVKRFRAERFPMPWLHAIDPEGKALDSSMAKLFQVGAIPRGILVDADGKIIAADDDIRGSKLEQRLEQLLGPGSRQPLSQPRSSLHPFAFIRVYSWP
jgi:thiol-disulfide isomerase/thioredoxin